MTEGGLGNQGWLPWWHGAAEGGAQFYRLDADGELVADDPDGFDTITPAELRAALDQLPAPASEAFKLMVPGGWRRSDVSWDAGGRPDGDYLVKRALGPIAPNAKDGRNGSGSWLAQQLRDNGSGRAEAEQF